MALQLRLSDEKERLDRVIAALESLAGSAPATGGAASGEHRVAQRRGRTSMTGEERQQVSERMKAYWAARRSHRR